MTVYGFVPDWLSEQNLQSGWLPPICTSRLTSFCKHKTLTALTNSRLVLTFGGSNKR